MPAGPFSSVRSRVVVASFLTQAFILGGVFSYGVFIPILETELGWSRTLLSAASSVGFLVMGMLAIPAGRLSDIVGPRLVLSVTGVLCGSGFVLMSTMEQPWQLILFFGLFVGIGLSSHDVVTLSTVAKWFDRRRGIMTAVVKIGTASGQMLIPIFASALFVWWGWRTALLVLGVIIAIMLLLVSQWMQRPVQALSGSAAKANGKSSAKTGSLLTGVTIADAKRSRTLWLMCAIQFCFFPALMTIPLHIVAHAKDLGMTTQVAATVLSTLGGASIAGRLLIGLLFDRVGGKLSLKTCLTVLATSLVTFLIVNDAQWLYLCALIYGIAHGGLFTVVSPTIAEYFGMKAHGAIFGTVVFFGTLGARLGPILAGIIYDWQGSYQLAFQILIVLACIGLIMASTLKPVVTDHL